MTSVGKAAGKMVEEIRRQFREIPGLLEGKAGVKPDPKRCVDISTSAALKEMILPGVLAASMPVIVGFILGKEALGGMLGGATVTGVPIIYFVYKFASIGAIIKATILINFINIFIAGPDVSLKGSPTVSPTTAAL